MAVDIVEHRQDGGCSVVHTEMGHGGTVLGNQVEFVTNVDGSLNRDYITIPCPVAGCGSVSTHPIGGGSNPPANQHQFARLWQMRAQQLGIPPEQRGWDSIKAMVCDAVRKMDGPDRTCYIEDSTGPDDFPSQGPPVATPRDDPTRYEEIPS